MKIGEAASGIGEEMADTGLAIQRAKDKTEDMQARAAAVDELVEAGTLEDFTADETALDRELAQISASAERGRRAREDEGRAGRRRRARQGAGGREGAVIVRLMGEGQYRVDDELGAALNDLDDQAVAALGRDDEPELDRFLDEMWGLVRARGTKLADDELGPRTWSSRRAT